MKQVLAKLGSLTAMVAMLTVVAVQGVHSPLHHLPGLGSGCCQAEQDSGTHQGCSSAHDHREGAHQHPAQSQQPPADASHDCQLCQMLAQSMSVSVPAALSAGPEISEILSEFGVRQDRLLAVTKPFSRGPPCS